MKQKITCNKNITRLILSTKEPLFLVDIIRTYSYTENAHTEVDKKYNEFSA